ncbi:MAG: hemerythrin domain-containing protein [Planctomycetota bacterium]
MSSWLSETEFRQAGADAVGITINVAFLQEIKADYDFRQLLNDTYLQLGERTMGWVSPRVAAELLENLRDELETYFALEEFYGYFTDAEVVNPCVGQTANQLRTDHQELFIQLNELVELAQQITYREIGPETTVADVFEQFETFCKDLAHHEQAEMDLMMRLCNEDIGVGD